jgi:transcription termination/antitermination protein NusA
VETVIMNFDERTATVVVSEDQLSLAIGKQGRNVSLAAKLTGWRIDIRTANQLGREIPSEQLAQVETLVANDSQASASTSNLKPETDFSATAGEEALVSGAETEAK